MGANRLYAAGIALGLLSAAGSAAIAVVLAGEEQLPTSWVLLIQSSVALLVSCAIPASAAILAAAQGGQTTIPMTMRTARYGRHFLRAVAGLAIYAFYYQSLKHAPKVDCSLLLNTAPLIVPILCVLTFRDKVPARAWAGVIVGFAGISLALIPAASFEALEPGHVLALLAGLAFACSTVLVRDLNRTERVTTTVFYYNAHCVVCLLVVLVVMRPSISLKNVCVCIVVGMVFCAKQYAITWSVKLTSATAASVLNFATIPMLAMYGVLVEGGVMPTATVLGGLLVAIGSFSAIVKRRDVTSTSTKDSLIRSSIPFQGLCEPRHP